MKIDSASVALTSAHPTTTTAVRPERLSGKAGEAPHEQVSVSQQARALAASADAGPAVAAGLELQFDLHPSRTAAANSSSTAAGDVITADGRRVDLSVAVAQGQVSQLEADVHLQQEATSGLDPGDAVSASAHPTSFRPGEGGSSLSSAGLGALKAAPVARYSTEPSSEQAVVQHLDVEA